MVLLSFIVAPSLDNALGSRQADAFLPFALVSSASALLDYVVCVPFIWRRVYGGLMFLRSLLLCVGGPFLSVRGFGGFTYLNVFYAIFAGASFGRTCRCCFYSCIVLLESLRL